jgi:4-diphosphocytidyl-2-C-methyl-D-erythritol kinase
LKKSDGIELTVDGLSEIEPKDNLAYKAARIVSEMVDYPGAQIILKKYIPTGAGLGGGSADAAFVVRGLMQLYGLKLERFELKRRMALLGADIPFFLGTGQSRATGIGDIIEPIDLPIDYQVLIVKPEISINTRWAYQTPKFA